MTPGNSSQKKKTNDCILKNDQVCSQCMYTGGRRNVVCAYLETVTVTI